ncbi:MAG: hypothetical protein Q9216_004815 [Gyalolechia sp. 2 TL-2023]
MAVDAIADIISLVNLESNNLSPFPLPAIRNSSGPASCLYITDIPKPASTPTSAIVKVGAFGLNRMDLLQREDKYPVPPQAPSTLGVEFSGVVESVGGQQSEGEEFKVGDEVFGLAYGGAYAEYINVSTHMLMRKPEELSWEEAAGIPETWITATQAMYLIGEFAPGKTILWHAGASSVSISGIQLSKGDNAGAIFVTAGSQEKIDFCVKDLGATAGFNYHTQDWAKEVLAATDGKGVDIIVDFIGQNYFQGNLDAAARDGRIVHLGAMSGTKLAAGVDMGAFVRKRLRFEGSSLRSRDEVYQGKLRNTLVEHALPLIRKGEMKVYVEKVFPWEEIVQAHELMESNQTKGKIILNMTKRPREEKDAVVDIGAAQSNGIHKTKKRKVAETKTKDVLNGAIVQGRLSAEEKRELKKLRRIAEGQHSVLAVNGDVEKRIARLESKKAAAKAARKAEKGRVQPAELSAPANVDQSKDNASVKTGKESKSKVDQKAKKEQRKASEQIERSGVAHLQVNTVTHGGPSGDISPEPAQSDSRDQKGRCYEEDKNLTSLSDSDIQSFLSSNFITVKDPSSPNPLRPITKFGFLPKSSQSSAFSTFKAPTAIQSAAWPFLLSGRDVIGVAETGSGKTLAFGIPCIRAVSSSTSKKLKNPARAVIVSPTRELAVQIHTQIEQLAIPAALKSVCVYGGVPKDPQRLALSTAHIVVATPGRLNDLIEEGSADLSQVEYLVLDEADRMLEKGFEDAIRTIISTTPSTAQGRQTLMFTATWPPSVRELAATFMNQAVHITIGDNNADGELRANNRIEQQVEVVDPRGKEQRMLQIVKKYQSGKNKNDRILVFCLYKKEATRVEGFLRSKGLRVAGIHGDLNQGARMAALEGFKKGDCPLLVATDVAARGLDIPSVKLVLNVTFPLTVEDYVHRIGRTGRAGAQGLAITLFTEHDKAQSGALINVLKAAGQPVPEALLKFGTTVKKKGHDAYGAFYKDTKDAKVSTKIRFD